MAIKWKLFFQDQRLALLFKAVIFGLLAVVLQQSEGAFPAIALFLGGGVFLYLTPLPKQKFRPAIFVIFLGFVFGAAIGKPFAVSAFLLFMISASFFFILLGIHRLFFIYRRVWHYVVFLALTYASLLSFFATNQSRTWFGKIILLTIVLWFLARDFFISYRSDVQRKIDLVPICAVTETVLVIELLWIVSLFPFPPLAAANLVFVGFFVVNNLLIASLTGNLTRREALIQTSVFVVIALLIFGSTRWVV